jgi:hypothetical protein
MRTEKDTLQQVFGVEQEISRKLAAERQLVDQWLDRTRREIEQAKLSEIAALQARTAQDEEAAGKAASERAAELLQQASAAAERVRGLADSYLTPIVEQRLAGLVPGNAP